MPICEYEKTRHLAGLRNCVIELQDFERAIDTRLPSGADIVDEYIPQMFFRCRACDGKVYVATIDDEVAGYVTILCRVESEGVEDGNLVYALVADLVVRNEFRGNGLGRQLLDAAEKYAKSHGANWLRIGTLSDNDVARELYTSHGFSSLYVELEKDLRHDG